MSRFEDFRTTMQFRLERVHFMPKALEPGVIYMSEDFSTAAHLCACGCGMKVRTPLGPAEWTIEEGKSGPCVRPSIGNWQQPCRSHYWIWEGEAVWAEDWSPEQVVAGREREAERRRLHYDTAPSTGLWKRLIRWLLGLWGGSR